jgi:hypothetical protein
VGLAPWKLGVYLPRRTVNYASVNVLGPLSTLRVQDKLLSVGERFPVVNGLLNAIRRKKSKVRRPGGLRPGCLGGLARLHASSGLANLQPLWTLHATPSSKAC